MMVIIIYIADTVPAAGFLNVSLLVPAVYNRKPKSKHTANPNPEPNHNRNTYLLQSEC